MLNIPGVGGYLYFISYFFIVCVYLVRYKHFTYLNSKKYLIVFSSIVGVFLVSSIVINLSRPGVFDGVHEKFIMKDTFFLLFMTLLAIWSLMIKKIDVFKSLLICNLVWVVTNLLLLISEISLFEHRASPGYYITPIALDEMQFLYFPMSLMLCFFSRVKSLKIYSYLLTIAHIYIITKIGISSQVILVLIFLIPMCFYVKFKAVRMIFLTLFVGGALFGSSDLESENLKLDVVDNDILVKKFNAVVELSSLDYDYLPWSPKVRVIELINVLDKNIYEVLIGNVLGGYIQETKAIFNFNQSSFPDDDFSVDQRSIKRYYSLHNVSNVILKFGVIFYIFLYYLLMKKVALEKGEYFATFLIVLTLTALNFGWTVRISALFILILPMLLLKEKKDHVSLDEII
ncbi:hypothetical protein PVK63_09355 [Aliivibrio sp. S2TY2]|uniref:hypothetical protein n=1 Tax=unclassified Aliivibrio TaxID=2645654 RepID=UPI002378065D|nr:MULTISPECIES: hypothetical protein [unclassified Aliivibrio]MDD9174896.1 hypothetical protein [Aliivibrio sp. S3TY1]MDD9192157.1 hypothetical protein [Aliivibrio sp. S2TY2]